MAASDGAIRHLLRKTNVILLPREKGKDMYSDGFVSQLRRQMSNFSPIGEELIEVFTPHRRRECSVREPVPAAE